MVEVGITSAPASTRIVQRAAERVLHEQLLQLQVGLGDCQCLLVLARRCSGRAPTSIGARLPISTCFLVSERVFSAERQRFLLHARVLVGVDEIPVHVLDLIDGRDDLQAESHVAKFAIVLGDADETVLGANPKPCRRC